MMLRKVLLPRGAAELCSLLKRRQLRTKVHEEPTTEYGASELCSLLKRRQLRTKVHEEPTTE
jgi:hypothetical protein